MIDKEIIAVFHYDDKGSKCCGREPYRYAEEIVRCKECKYWDDRREDDWWSKEGACTITSRLGDATYRNHDDFCSYGERRKP